MHHARILPVILAGGDGERLWPLSKRNFPKQFVSFDASGQSLFQQTLARVADADRFAAPIILCNEAHRFIVAEQLDGRDATIIVEPYKKNTAPALALAALHAAPEDVLLVLPSDHRIADEAAFLQAIATAQPAAADGMVMTFACTPTAPETGYGYIKAGEPLAVHPAIRRIARFTEKPTYELAETYLAEGNYGWNSGIFMLQASTALAELAAHAPAVLQACEAAHAARTVDLGFLRPERTALADCPGISIDYAVMEHTTRGAVLPVTMGWSDLGSWNALHQLETKDMAGNSGSAPHLLQDTQGCHVQAHDRLVATIGLRDLVIVSANDALLIAPKDRMDEMKPLLQEMGTSHAAMLGHTRLVHRPWGHFERVDAGDHYQVKKLWLKAGGQISLQSHALRAEHWVVVQGRATVTNGDDIRVLEQNQSTYIPAGAVHRLENRESVPLIVIEIQTGDHLAEDDITRLEDAYNRD